MKCDTVYCAPKILRENQYNCAFFGSYYGTPECPMVSVYQFDIKGDKDKVYEFTLEEFKAHWEVLSIM